MRGFRSLGKKSVSTNKMNKEGCFLRGAMYGTFLSIILWISIFGWIRILHDFIH